MNDHLSGAQAGAVAPLSSLIADHPAIATLSLAEISTLWRLGCAAKKNRVLTYAWFQTVFGLTVSQARSRVARLCAAGVLERILVGTRTRPEGHRYTLTTAGIRLCQMLAPALARPDTAAGQGGREVQASAPAPVDLLPRLSEKARATLATLPPAPRSAIEESLAAGRHPDYELLAAMGLSDQLATSLHNVIDRLLDQTTPLVKEGTDATRLAAPTPEQVERARALGVPVPRITAAREGAAQWAETAQLILSEAAVRHSDLLRQGKLLGRLPELLWATLSGSLADYGPPLLRVRVALRLLALGRWSTPKGFREADRRSLLGALAIAA